LKAHYSANPTYFPPQTTRRYFGMQNNALRRRSSYEKRSNKITGKEQDAETGLYYYGARYLDPKTSRWLSGDPAMGEYLPVAPVSDEAKKRNQNLPGQGGVFNYVNLHVYHYAGNNPVKYVDPDGKQSGFVTNESAVGRAGHSGMWVELYNENGNSIGYAFFEVNPIDKNAYKSHGGEPLARWMVIVGGGSVGSIISGSRGSIAGSSIGTIINETEIRVGVNEYRFYSSEGVDAKKEMEKFIANRWFNDETATDKIRNTAFGISAAQDLLILEAAISNGDSFGRYDILSNNCAQYASKALSAGGVNTSSQTIPNCAHDYIDKNNSDLIEK